MTPQKKRSQPFNLIGLWQAIRARHHVGAGLWALVGVLLILSVLAGTNLDGGRVLYVAGQLADRTVDADRDLLVEDVQATKARRDQVEMLQPPVYDHSMEAFVAFQRHLLEAIQKINEGGGEPDGSGGEEPAGEASQARALLRNISGVDAFHTLARPDVQTALVRHLLPAIRERMAVGLVGDVRSARAGQAGIIIRSLDTETEILRPDMTSLADLPSFLAELFARMKRLPELSDGDRRVLHAFFSTALQPSLTFNREATQKRLAAVAQNVEPVRIVIQRGEILVRKGDRVSREAQVKIKALHDAARDPLRPGVVLGAFLLSLIISAGFFVSPGGGLKGSPMHRKDLLLVSLVLLVFGLGAKGLFVAGLRVDHTSFASLAATAFPVAGGVGLAASVFAARRYCTIGILLCFFCTLMFQADLSFFIHHFLGAMLATWIVSSAQTRQDVVWGVFPLAGGQMLVWIGAAALSQSPLAELPPHLCAAAIGSLLSLIVLFAFSPVLEISFGYSTRFRLMELMSLEQPLMQELMVTIPGTYHHSLVVANMVESGARAVGANALLCKVAALYHDAGKLAYPEYYIENQFGGPNKHDRLAPSMSALIILSHVKKGTELAERHGLGQEITDIIRQHHGTRCIRFFYQKALNLGENPSESDYSYPGPRPQSREAAILMLADCVEASSRTLVDPTPARLRSHIEGIIRSIFSEGQLDESELTFRDLHHLAESFHRTLTAIFHQRIVYPEARISRGGAGGGQQGRTAQA